MRKVLILLLSLGLLAGFAGYSFAREAKEIKCSGKVIDDQGKPVAGAKVTLFNVTVVMETSEFDVKPVQNVITKADGVFTLKMPNNYNDSTEQLLIVVEKEGQAIGWANWHSRKNLEIDIVLGKPKVLAGQIIDESDNPVSDAEVSMSFMVIQDKGKHHYMLGKASEELFAAKTDAEGRFTFNRIPANASAEFTITKTGRATINTFDPTNFSGGKLKYVPGQADIRIESPIETKIDGIVVEKGTDKPVAGVRLMLVKGRDQPNFGNKPVVSKDDGTFTINSLVPGKHILQLVPTKEGMADWVVELVEVTTEPAGTKSGVKIEVVKGGLLEIVVTEAVSKKPVEKVNVILLNKQNSQRFGAQSDKNGLAQIRLLPGEYQIQGVHKKDYSSGTQQESVTIEDNKTTNIEIQLTGKPKVTGVVRDQAGEPVEGATIKLCPMGNYNTETDADGKFELKWNPQSWGSQQETLYYLVVRQKQRNLAAAVEIEEDDKTLDIKLAPGVVFAGVVVDTEGKAISGAKITVMLRASNWGSPITDWRQQGGTLTDAEGKFEVKAIPPECKYNVRVSAEEYGKRRVEALADDAVDGRLDLGRFTLALANLSVSGLVVDGDDKPVSGARIFAHGEGQPERRSIQTDAQGKFTIEKVCPGRLRINANTQGKKRLHGNIEVEGGATDVRIVVAESGSSRRRFVPKQPPSLAGKPLPAFEGLNLQIDPTGITDKVILVCFWDMQQRPSRHCIKELAKQADQLKEKGVVVIAVQASTVDKNTLNDWVKKYNIPFTVGMIEGNEEKTRFTWGVKSLPWLILTDKKHIVRSNGFSLSELDEKMKEMAN